MRKLRLVIAAVLALLIAIVALQNTEAVETRLLFATVTMPRAVLIFTTAAIGFGLGVLAALFWARQQKEVGRDGVPSASD